MRIALSCTPDGKLNRYHVFAYDHTGIGLDENDRPLDFIIDTDESSNKRTACIMAKMRFRQGWDAVAVYDLKELRFCAMFNGAKQFPAEEVNFRK